LPLERGGILGDQRDLEHIPLTRLTFERVGRVQREQASAVDDRDTVGQPFGFVHVVGRQHDGLVPRERSNVLAHQDPALWVQSNFRFVEHKQVRVVHQRHDQVQPALHAP